MSRNVFSMWYKQGKKGNFRIFQMDPIFEIFLGPKLFYGQNRYQLTKTGPVLSYNAKTGNRKNGYSMESYGASMHVNRLF